MAFEDWDKLLYGIHSGECILFLGSDLPLEAASGERSVPTSALTGRLAATLRGENGGGEGFTANQLAHVAQRFLAQEDEVGLEMELTRWHTALAAERSALHDDLAALPFRRIVTSSHDPLMETALRQAGKAPAVGRYHYRGKNVELLPEPSHQAPLLFHLYGHVAEPRSVVLTETQLLDFLAALISKNPPLPNDLNAALTHGRLFLFLGFGLQQWYLRILLHVLKVLMGSRAFALETLDEGARNTAGNAILFYRENFKVDVHFEDVGGFVKQLRARYVPPPAVSSTAAKLPPAAVDPQAIEVFICHAGEDQAKAREVHDALKRAGLRPWLDRESLRGGDRWDGLIEATIKGVDCVVVVNSRALVAKSQEASYVNKEIKVALRAEDWRMGRFIIPAKIDDAPLIELLRDFHAVDLTQPGGMRDLIRAVKRQNRNVVTP